MSDALDALRARFIYRSDIREKWRILRDEGQVWGDCEDFSLTLAWLISGRILWRFWWNAITFRFIIWHCVTEQGEQHACIWVRGKGWADNIYSTWSKRKRFKLIFPWIAPMLALKLLIGRL